MAHPLTEAGLWKGLIITVLCRRIFFLLVLAGCESLPRSQLERSSLPCSPDWNRVLEVRIGTGDGHGHGPDIGSIEWYYVIHRKLKWPESASLIPGSSVWCYRVDQAIQYER